LALVKRGDYIKRTNGPLEILEGMDLSRQVHGTRKTTPNDLTEHKLFADSIPLAK
jgi:hypothetical protein